MGWISTTLTVIGALTVMYFTAQVMVGVWRLHGWRKSKYGIYQTLIFLKYLFIRRRWEAEYRVLERGKYLLPWQADFLARYRRKKYWHKEG